MAAGRVILLCLAAIVGFAATSFALRQSVSMTTVYRDADPVRVKVRRVLADSGVDVLFVGTSRTYLMVDPDRFDAVMSAGGHPTHSYVAALPSMSVPETEALLRGILDGHASRLKVVFIEPDFATFTPALKVAANRSIHFFAALNNI